MKPTVSITRSIERMPEVKFSKSRKTYEALERILDEGLERYPCRILSYQLLPSHWHPVLQPTEDGAMSNFLRWVTLTHTQ